MTYTQEEVAFSSAIQRTNGDRRLSTMDNLSDVCHVVWLIVRQILIFLRDFISHESSAPTEESLGDVSAKIRAAAPEQTIADVLVFLAACGLLLGFVMLTAGSPKDGTSGHDIETIPMAFVREPSPFCLSKSASSWLANCFHAVDRSRNIVSPPARSRSMSSPREDSRPVKSAWIDAVDARNVATAERTIESRARSCSTARCNSSQRLRTRTTKTHTMPREWLVRRTRSGHVYGKYPI